MSVPAKTVLVSGAEGYLALHLAHHLRQSQYRVLTASRRSGDFRMDFSRPSEVASLPAGGIDAMVHLVSPNEGMLKNDPLGALAEAAAGIHAALDFCKANGIPDFIYVSSFHVFGSTGGVLTEQTAPAPRNDYGLSHLIAEQTVQMFDRAGPINGWIVRPSNVFGVPHKVDAFKRWHLIPFLFCREAIERRLITLLTPGRQLRNFVGASDVCGSILWLLEERPKERMIHAYGKETLSVLQYARLVQRIAQEQFGLPVRIEAPERADSSVEFEFTSRIEHPRLEPRASLEAFVRDMLSILMNKDMPINHDGSR
ncbi:NAD-dependent epimerase/dehydratase family protein [Paenibacillus methanolicus]|uniref:UDP-glucose 4-epimerase n=1 Tax=Paenibacillus methanolicus TaxID=582686 RepID=A0A5S5C8R7_9BACL|nr:NAD(P)-dependent oxidoreductase [Paenibacillus methanolicus]TYP75734.1 UDP-glucose 4-epimerase [Paenibacillus methanolicus]